MDGPPIPSVNFHLTEACDMGCDHCYVKDIGAQLPAADAARVVGELAGLGFEKINFAGGEPTLHPGLDALVRLAKDLGMTTSVVTNGRPFGPPGRPPCSGLHGGWLEGLRGSLDWLALSVDSALPSTHALLGRAGPDGPYSPREYVWMSRAARRQRVRVKVNTVVTALNHMEDMSGLVRLARPERWKVMQMLPVRGQNDAAAGRAVTAGQFRAYAGRARRGAGAGVAVVAEDNAGMTASYAMVDPEGRFFDNAGGEYRRSRPILEAGAVAALREVRVDPGAFERRGGRYGWAGGAAPQSAQSPEPDQP